MFWMSTAWAYRVVTEVSSTCTSTIQELLIWARSRATFYEREAKSSNEKFRQEKKIDQDAATHGVLVERLT